jgi:hypothetical protein
MKHKNSLGFVLGFLLCLASGCVSMSTDDSVRRAPTTQIDCFRDGLSPSRPYKEIGTLERKGDLDDQASIEKQFVTKAKAVGGNGLLLMRAPTLRGDYTFSAKIIVYE